MLPVIPHANKYTVMSMCLNKSELWKFMKKFKLSTNMRLQVSDENNFQQLIDFAAYLNNIGHGTEQTIDHNDLIRLNTTKKRFLCAKFFPRIGWVILLV